MVGHLVMLNALAVYAGAALACCCGIVSPVAHLLGVSLYVIGLLGSLLGALAVPPCSLTDSRPAVGTLYLPNIEPEPARALPPRERFERLPAEVGIVAPGGFPSVPGC